MDPGDLLVLKTVALIAAVITYQSGGNTRTSSRSVCRIVKETADGYVAWLQEDLDDKSE